MNDKAVGEQPPSAGADGSARVQCNECAFRWYGLTAVHGLSIIGRCPHCSGTLRFSEHPDAASAPPADVDSEAPGGGENAELEQAPLRARRPADRGPEPSRVLGLPDTWNR